jgi:hypothetical protein
MLRVDPDAMRDWSRRDYYHRLANYLRRNASDLVASLTNSQLESEVAYAVEKARGYGAESGVAILKFVTISLVAGLNFDDAPEIKSYLIDPEYSPEDKIDELAKSLAEEIQHNG